MPQPLGRLLDPSALDASQGARARLVVRVPHGWLEHGGEIELTLPSRLACARCDAGGCDGCGRSGAYRLDQEALVRAHLPARRATEGGAFVLRLVRPLDGDPLEQLHLEVRPSDEASPFVRRITPLTLPEPPSARPRWLFVALAVALALLAAIALTR